MDIHKSREERASGDVRSLVEQAIEIAATGLPVFPCGPEKTPVCARGFHAATTDPAKLRSLFAHSAACMIGMPTGAASGVIVVDIDPRHDGDAWLAENAHRLPVTRRHGTMSGGVHLLFHDAGLEIRNSAGKIKDGRKQGIAPGVDVRGNGGYIVIPPSPLYSIADPSPIADMPEWLVELCRKPPETVERSWPAPPARGARLAPGRAPDASPYGAAAVASAADEIRSAPEGSKHDVINRVGYSVGGLVSAGEVLEGDAWAAIDDALASIRARCKDFRAAQKTLRRAFMEGKARPRDVPERVTIEEADDPITAPFLEMLEAAEREAAAGPLPVSDALMDVGGAIGQFVEYCNETAISPQPFLALAAGICAVGALAGRKYRSQSNLRTNIYCVSIAESGAGKDAALARVSDVLCAAGLADFLGGADIASGTGLMTSLGKHPCRVFILDEFGDWMTDVIGPKAAPHKKALAQRLKALFSAAGRMMPGIEFADQGRNGRPREDVWAPHACILGATTPGQFWGAFSSENLNDGLLPRFIIFESPNSYPDRRRGVAFIDPPTPLVKAFKAIAEGPATDGGELGKIMMAGTMPEPYTVAMTGDAEAVLYAMEDRQLERQRRNKGSSQNAIVARIVEHAIKLAMVRAISNDPKAPAITGSDMKWGAALAEHSARALIREAGDSISDNPFARSMQAAKAIIRKHGPISAAGMIAKGWAVPERERGEVLRALVESEQVIAKTAGGGKGQGRQTTRFTIVPTQE